MTAYAVHVAAVAEALAPSCCSNGCVEAYLNDCLAMADATIAVETLTPLVEADLRERIATDIEARRIVCPVHGMPDCSPLLNGCPIPNMLVRQRDEDARIARGGA